MHLKRISAVLGVLGLAGLLGLGTPARTQQPVADQGNGYKQDGVEPLARGPVHEAYATPVQSKPEATITVPRQPPDPLEELPPEQKPEGENVTWMPGYWAWDEDRTDFIWVSGFWRAPPPNQQWVPGRWQQTSGAWQWVPGFWQSIEEREVRYLPPPPELVEAAPSVPAPAPESVFVPGCWVYRDVRYVWRPGYWMNYRPGWVWIPAHYVWSPLGYVFVDGYWDFELNRRGLLFSPVHVDRRYWALADWHYRPYYVVRPDFMLTAFFVRPRYSHYYFGDYFDGGYRNRGFTAFVDYRFGRVGYDPLYSYYRWQHRDNRVWDRDLRQLYVARFNNEVPRPPRTLVQQATLIQNITVNKNVTNITNVNNVTVLRGLPQVNNTFVNLQAVSPQARQAAQQQTQQIRSVGRQRSQLETQLLAQGGTTTQPQAQPRAVRLDMPARPSAERQAAAPQPPPVPVTPLRAETGRANPRGNARTEPRAEPKGDPRTQPRGEPKAEPRAQPRVEPKAEPRPLPQPAPKAEPPTRPKVEPKPPEPRPQPKPPEPKAEPRPQPKPPEVKPPVPAPAPKVEPQPKPPEVRPEPQPKPPEVRPEPRAQPHPEPKVEPRPEPRREVPPPPRPEPRVEPRPQPQPRPEVRPEPPRPQPRPPEVRPQPQPQPRPEPRPPAPAPKAEDKKPPK